MHSKPRFPRTAGRHQPSSRSLRALIAMAVVSALAAVARPPLRSSSSPRGAASDQCSRSASRAVDRDSAWGHTRLESLRSLSVRLGFVPRFKPDFSEVTITGDKRGRGIGRPNSSINEALTSAATVYETPNHALREWRARTSPASVERLRKQLEESAPGASGVVITVTAEVWTTQAPSRCASSVHASLQALLDRNRRRFRQRLRRRHLSA